MDTAIEGEQELLRAYEDMARLSRLHERCLNEPLWDADMREIVAAGVRNAMRKLEREIADYLAERQLKAA